MTKPKTTRALIAVAMALVAGQSYTLREGEMIGMTITGPPVPRPYKTRKNDLLSLKARRRNSKGKL